jgi:hypothetical protein
MASPTITVQNVPAGHPSWQKIFEAILAAVQATEPIFLQFLPPAAQAGVVVGTALAPAVEQTVAAVSEAAASN